ncbi:hypothetical protein BH11PSE11_BH11PSE11_06030 [soil metagenome]
MFKRNLVSASAGVWFLFMTAQAGSSDLAGVKSALEGERFGLFSAEQFQITTGKCQDCASIKQGLWYFQDDVLAVPKPSLPVAGFSKESRSHDDIRKWANSPEARTLTYPPLVWLGAPQILDNVSITPDGKQVRSRDGTLLNFEVTPKIATNLSYYDPSSVAFFGQRQVRMRGTLKQENNTTTFVARSIWPKDFIIDQSKLANSPLKAPESLVSFVQHEGGGAKSPYATRLIWERNPGAARQWQDKPVLGVMLNGAQGDDDEAYGGHFAVATGKFGRNGEWADWMVNNFYSLDSVSEKGIIAASVPMDNYLADLNSGQQYYRPSYMLVAVLNNPRTAEAYQGGVQRLYNHFYRHDFVYNHSTANCTGISLDVFTALGWNIPKRGPTSAVKAIGAYGYLSAKEMSLASGRKIYNYLTEEQIRLYPAVAFDAAGNDLLQLVGASPGLGRALSEYEKQLQSDIEALVLVRIPQLPSSRVAGSNPIYSFDEFMQRTPADRSKWKVVPVGARPFPPELRDGMALQEEKQSLVPLPIIEILGVVGLLVIVAMHLRRRKKRTLQGR